MRVAAVDLGSNTTRLLVADVNDGRLEEVHRETRVTRIATATDSSSAGICATKPSPIVSSA